jgi:hypothetical protein
MIDGADFRASFANLVTALQTRDRIRCPLFAFLIPLAVRTVPEVLMGPYIVGFDPIAYYVPFVYSWLRHGVDFWGFLAEAPLFYCILTLITLLGIDIVFALKVVAPLLHGFLALSVYGYASCGLGWSPRKSFSATLLATLYFVAMRISWDLLRNELALIFLFLALTMIHRGHRSWRGFDLLPLTMVLVTLSHELTTVILFIIVGAVVLRSLFKGKHVEARGLILASLPAVLLFLLIFYAKCMTSSGEFLRLLLSFPRKASEGWFSIYGFSSYPHMVVDMLGFLIYCHMLLLPFAVRGAKSLRNFQMKSWTLWSLAAILIPVITHAKVNAYRWTLMLTYPFSFYATEALTNIKLDHHRLLVLLTLGMFTAGFITLPFGYGFPYFAIPQYQKYIPSSMLQNSVPVSDCQDTVNLLQWLKNGMNEDARLLTHRAFYGWALLMLGEDQIIHYEYGNPEKVAEGLADDGYGEIYLLWWVNGFGWHGQPTVSSSFREVRRSGRMAIYIYTVPSA